MLKCEDSSCCQNVKRHFQSTQLNKWHSIQTLTQWFNQQNMCTIVYIDFVKKKKKKFANEILWELLSLINVWNETLKYLYKKWYFYWSKQIEIQFDYNCTPQRYYYTIALEMQTQTTFTHIMYAHTHTQSALKEWGFYVLLGDDKCWALLPCALNSNSNNEIK